MTNENRIFYHVDRLNGIDHFRENDRFGRSLLHSLILTSFPSHDWSFNPNLDELACVLDTHEMFISKKLLDLSRGEWIIGDGLPRLNAEKIEDEGQFDQLAWLKYERYLNSMVTSEHWREEDMDQAYARSSQYLYNEDTPEYISLESDTRLTGETILSAKPLLAAILRLGNRFNGMACIAPITVLAAGAGLPVEKAREAMQMLKMKRLVEVQGAVIFPNLEKRQI